jgi:hypothetical protein
MAVPGPVRPDVKTRIVVVGTVRIVGDCLGPLPDRSREALAWPAARA